MTLGRFSLREQTLLTITDSTRNEYQGNIDALRSLNTYPEKRNKILDWISSVDFSSRHKAVSNERVENSGTWFLRSDAYKNWLNGTASNVLCCQGMRKLLIYCIG